MHSLFSHNIPFVIKNFSSQCVLSMKDVEMNMKMQWNSISTLVMFSIFIQDFHNFHPQESSEQFVCSAASSSTLQLIQFHFYSHVLFDICEGLTRQANAHEIFMMPFLFSLYSHPPSTSSFAGFQISDAHTDFSSRLMLLNFQEYPIPRTFIRSLNKSNKISEMINHKLNNVWDAERNSVHLSLLFVNFSSTLPCWTKVISPEK